MEEEGPHGAEGAERERFVCFRGFVWNGHCRKRNTTVPVVLVEKVEVAPNFQIFIRFFLFYKDSFFLPKKKLYFFKTNFFLNGGNDFVFGFGLFGK